MLSEHSPPRTARWDIVMFFPFMLCVMLLCDLHHLHDSPVSLNISKM